MENSTTSLDDIIINEIILRVAYFDYRPLSILLIGENKPGILDLLTKSYPEASISLVEVTDDTGDLKAVKLKLPADAYDLIIWCGMPSKGDVLAFMLAQLARGLKPASVFICARLQSYHFGRQNQPEPSQPHTESVHQMGDIILKSGFYDPVMDVEHQTVPDTRPCDFLKSYGMWLGNPELSSAACLTDLPSDPTKETEILVDVIYGVAKGNETTSGLIHEDTKGRRYIPLNKNR